ncbi:hypothetical protein BD410DRAFT_721273, partial [Rickenella mellea]
RPPTPPPTTSKYIRSRSSSNNGGTDWKELDISLVGSHSLWAHHLWNASRALADFLDENPGICRGRNVLELGAGGGLPGLVAALNGARKVVLTDYPDDPLLENLRSNVETNIPSAVKPNISVLGYVWGRRVETLISASDATSDGDSTFDIIIMSDLIFNHSQHDALLKTCDLAFRFSNASPIKPLQHSNQPTTLDPKLPLSSNLSDLSQPIHDRKISTPNVLVFYSHHRPHLASRDLAFFDLARERGWICKEIVTRRFPPMFPEDPGDEEVRSTVHGWCLTR